MKHYNYLPAVLVEGKTNWYIEYHQQKTHSEERQRFRPTANMNRVKDLVERRKIGMAFVHQLNNKLLPYGYPFVKIEIMPDHINILDALDVAMTIKGRGDKKKTVRTYASVVNHFKKYLHQKELQYINLHDFGYREAVNYMDFLTASKNPGTRTYNNYRQFLTAIWSELLDRGYAKENIFGRVKKLKLTDKERRMLDKEEAQAILSHVKKTDKMLFLSILLLHYCFVRPGEMRQLRVHHIDLANGVISVPGHISKNNKSEIVTIPKEVIPYLEALGLNEWYRNDYIFGKGVAPHPNIMCGENTLNYRHNKVIKTLLEYKLLRDITGLSLYSWKDTGAMNLIRSGIDAYEIMRQMRHSDLSITQTYLKSLSHINTSIRDLSLELNF